MNEEYYNSDLAFEIQKQVAAGNCCTSCMIKMYLDQMDEENDTMIEATKSLCNGLYTGSTCGALLGAVLMQSMADASIAPYTAPELVHWFKESYGNTDCYALAGENGERRAEVCVGLICACYMKAWELLSEYGIEP